MEAKEVEQNQIFFSFLPFLLLKPSIPKYFLASVHIT